MADYSNFRWLVHPEYEPHRVPDNPGVVPLFDGRGWRLTDIPGELDSDTEEFADALAEWQELQDSGETGDPPAFEQVPSNEAGPATSEEEAK